MENHLKNFALRIVGWEEGEGGETDCILEVTFLYRPSPRYPWGVDAIPITDGKCTTTSFPTVRYGGNIQMGGTSRC